MKVAALIVLAIATVGCGLHGFGHRVIGSGKTDTKEVKVGKGQAVEKFTRIRANGPYEIEVSQGPQSAIKITGDDNIVALVKTRIDDDTLVIETEENYSTDKPLKISVTMPEVKGLELNGSGDVSVSNLDGKELDLELNGSGGFKLNGKVEKLRVEVNGSGDIDATALEAKQAQADISGSGSVRVFAKETLDADISGSGEVRFKGSPKVNKSVTGSGDVSAL